MCLIIEKLGSSCGSRSVAGNLNIEVTVQGRRICLHRNIPYLGVMRALAMAVAKRVQVHFVNKIANAKSNEKQNCHYGANMGFCPHHEEHHDVVSNNGSYSNCYYCIPQDIKELFLSSNEHFQVSTFPLKYTYIIP